MFVALQGRERGVPARLGVVSNETSEESGPLVMPYPDWTWNKIGDCNGFTTIYRLHVREFFLINNYGSNQFF